MSEECNNNDEIGEFKLLVTQLKEADISPNIYQDLLEIGTRMTRDNSIALFYTSKCKQLFETLQLFGNDHHIIHLILQTRDKILGKT